VPKVLNKYKAGVPHGAVYCGPNKKAVSLQVKFSKDFLPTLSAEPTVIAGLQASTAPAPSHAPGRAPRQAISQRSAACAHAPGDTSDTCPDSKGLRANPPNPGEVSLVSLRRPDLERDAGEAASGAATARFDSLIF